MESGPTVRRDKSGLRAKRKFIRCLQLVISYFSKTFARFLKGNEVFGGAVKNCRHSLGRVNPYIALSVISTYDEFRPAGTIVNRRPVGQYGHKPGPWPNALTDQPN